MKEKILLVKFVADWADEIDFEEYGIMNKQDYYEMLKYIKYLEVKRCNQSNVGTNEEIELWTDNFSKKYITEEERKILCNTILKYGNATTHFPRESIMDSGIWKNLVSLDEIKERDELKNKFCIKYNIPLVRIPYYKLKTLVLEDLIGDKYLIKEGDNNVTK